MRHRFAVVLVAAAFVVMAASPSAHHSVSGQYDSSKPLTLTGVITKVDWINPHIYLHLDVKEKDGAVTSWTLSTLPTAMMRRAGLTKESIQGKPGEVVTITAIAARRNQEAGLDFQDHVRRRSSRTARKGLSR